MRKTILAVAAAGSIFMITAAGAAGLGTLTSDNVKLATSGTTSTITTNACSDAYTVNYGYDATGELIAKAGLTNGAAETPDADCVGVPYAIVVTADGADYTVSGTTDESGDAALASLSASIPYGDLVTNVKVTIGPKG